MIVRRLSILILMIFLVAACGTPATPTAPAGRNSRRADTIRRPGGPEHDAYPVGPNRSVFTRAGA